MIRSLVAVVILVAAASVLVLLLSEPGAASVAVRSSVAPRVVAAGPSPSTKLAAAIVVTKASPLVEESAVFEEEVAAPKMVDLAPEEETVARVASEEETERALLEVVFKDETGRAVQLERAEVELSPWAEEPRTQVWDVGTPPPALELGAWTATLRVAEPRDLGAAPRHFRVERGANRLVLVVKRLGLLRGIVRSTAGEATPFEVSVEPASGDVVHLACDAEGRFEWRGLGAARVRAEAEGHGVEVLRVELGSGSVKEVAVDLRPGTALAVHATLADGAPAAFEEVVAWPEGEPERAVRTALDENGRAKLCLAGAAPFHVAVAGTSATASGGELALRVNPCAGSPPCAESPPR